ncbi:MBL fold metallo-hydrolase [Roseobacter sp. HKCCA0434]|uniref:MBL fold metallo-hydrolase n=1 Tax=Roseobacter sp. HKCCA0434 TaxID=3079297 RepID=UPI002905EE79|nr:MBL fold metallo-hydrolase [Roseobacter sp. HKCCA0434]
MIDTTLTRRAALALGGAALAAPAFAGAPLLGPSRPFHRRVQLGEFEVTTLLDVATPVPDPHTIFGTEQDPETVKELLRQNNLPTGTAEFTFAPTLVNTGEELILFDTGNGDSGMAPGQLVSRMMEAGYGPDQVDVVVLTHMHPDHIGGLTDAGSPVFTNARYVTGQTEYDFWNSPDRMGTPAEGTHQLVQQKMRPLADQTTFIAPGDAVASGIEAVEAFGHTPGHMAYHIESAGQRLMLIADVANHFVLSMERPDWEVRFDADKAAAAATRRKVLGMIAADGIPFIGYHMPFPAMGYLEENGEGFAFEAMSYQLNL